MSWDFEVGVPKFSKLGLSWLWGPITLCAYLWLKWGLKKSCSPHWYLFNSMWHTTCTEGIQGNSRLLMVGNQIGNLTPDLSFGHNLWFKYPNVSYKPILNIYVLKDFQCYKEFFNLMGFDPCNLSLKIWESIGILIPKVGAHLGVWKFIPSHSPTLLGAWNVIFELHS